MFLAFLKTNSTYSRYIIFNALQDSVYLLFFSVPQWHKSRKSSTKGNVEIISEQKSNPPSCSLMVTSLPLLGMLFPHSTWSQHSLKELFSALPYIHFYFSFYFYGISRVRLWERVSNSLDLFVSFIKLSNLMMTYC